MCNILEYTATVIGHTMRYAMEICLQNVFTFDHTVQAQFNFRSLVLSCFTFFLRCRTRCLYFIVARKQYCLMIEATRSMQTLLAGQSLQKQLVTTTCVQVHVFLLTHGFSISFPLHGSRFLSIYLFIFVCLYVLS